MYPATQGFVPVGFSYGVISARNGHAIPGKSEYAGVAAVHGACGMVGGNCILAPVGLTNGLWRDGSILYKEKALSTRIGRFESCEGSDVPGASSQGVEANRCVAFSRSRCAVKWCQ